MGVWGIGHWLVVLAVLLLVFGTKRLSHGAQDLAKAIREFKKAMGEPDGQVNQTMPTIDPPTPAKPVETDSHSSSSTPR